MGRTHCHHLPQPSSNENSEEHLRIQIPRPCVVLDVQTPASAVWRTVRRKVGHPPGAVHGCGIDISAAAVTIQRDILRQVEGARECSRRVPARKGAAVCMRLVRFCDESQAGGECPVLDEVKGAPTGIILCLRVK